MGEQRKRSREEGGGDGRVSYRCECGHRVYMSAWYPSLKEVEKWQDKAQCCSCGKRYKQITTHND